MEPDKSDIDVNALGAGCLASFGAGCLSTILLVFLVVVSGIQLARVRPENLPVGIKFVGFLLGTANHILVGYVTAQKARQGKMLHALIMGGVLMIFGIMSFISPLTKEASFKSFAPLTWMLTIPLCLLGAKWAIDTEQKPESGIQNSEEDHS